jgi:hypothetical protein
MYYSFTYIPIAYITYLSFMKDSRAYNERKKALDAWDVAYATMAVP